MSAKFGVNYGKVLHATRYRDLCVRVINQTGRGTFWGEEAGEMEVGVLNVLLISKCSFDL